uniref:Solute carrier family 28 member 3 n=1 Tax=Oreochromis niloticus TaxID=8128 RepID=A0A669EXP9_ORENI
HPPTNPRLSLLNHYYIHNMGYTLHTIVFVQSLCVLSEFLHFPSFFLFRIIYMSVLVAAVCWLALDTAQRGTRQLVSFFGLLLFVFLTLLFSKHPFRWSWQTLVFGIGLQFIFGLFILRTTFGLGALQWLGNKAEAFMSFADTGSKFVFGESYTDHFFAFRVMPILVFLSSVISMLYHIGFMAWLICKIGFIMQVTMGTSPAESMAAAGNIFLGHTDSPLLIRPYISELTLSEIHAVMTGGFASISGTILGAYISFGVDATHLLTATVMSAPASLAIAKMFWPETSVLRSNRPVKMDKGESKNLLEAASLGASRAIALVASVLANIIAFMALLALFDAVLSWLGGMFDCPQLSFSLICSYVFMPLSFMMGVSFDDSFIVAELMGIKTFLNEFVAYQKLSELINRRKAGGPEYVNNVKQYISVSFIHVLTISLLIFNSFPIWFAQYDYSLFTKIIGALSRHGCVHGYSLCLIPCFSSSHFFHHRFSAAVSHCFDLV